METDSDFDEEWSFRILITYWFGFHVLTDFIFIPFTLSNGRASIRQLR